MNNGEPTDYGFGWDIGKYHNYRILEHDGSWIGWNTNILRFPTLRLSVIVLSNIDPLNPVRISHDIASIYLGVALKLSIKTTR